MENINLKGIMALPKLTNDKKEREFMMKSVVDLSFQLQKKYPDASVISLGTTSDFDPDDLFSFYGKNQARTPMGSSFPAKQTKIGREHQ